ncbi:hypothetical protein ASPCADRAFT_127493 [Aspergillus carbonarius ITEM 5010]|uniref:Uncharacterized protein n=1 Tax=Aspergillus carbonarius (strain ITEM 5010) TaxID=602072 RepID=A0A1R3RWN9_ASPC5|nr:hypothetical protein ASPCADRAFT_127493 [Aspergillus carbonarius ITEM 5010]
MARPIVTGATRFKVSFGGRDHKNQKYFSMTIYKTLGMNSITVEKRKTKFKRWLGIVLRYMFQCSLATRVEGVAEFPVHTWDMEYFGQRDATYSLKTLRTR